MELESQPFTGKSPRQDGVRFQEPGGQGPFFFSSDGKRWTPIGQPQQMVYTLPHFMGYRFGLFNFATGLVGDKLTPAD